MTLGENILTLRKRDKLSQEKLAEQMKVSRQTISNWELDETTPKPEQLKILSQVFNISIDKLLDNDNMSEEAEFITQKITNTERMVNMLSKALKFIGITISIILAVDIMSFIAFFFLR